MSAPRLVLKQSTGWFAAGWTFGEAMTVLSDAAFKLFAWLCLKPIATPVNCSHRAGDRGP